MWTSTNSLSILVIIFYYVGANSKVKRTIVGIKHVNSNKTGKNLAVVVIEVIKD